MAKSMTLNVRVNGPLGDFVAAHVGDAGTYENVSEYIRDLIRKDKERTELEMFDRLKAELRVAFTAADDTFVPLTADEIIARNRAPQSA
jgi:antitoxin ParD1/3/4